MAVDPAMPRSLTPTDEKRLADAYHELRDAVRAFDERFGNGVTPGDEDLNARDRLAAERGVAAVEAGYWKVRYEVLGETRPPIPPALLMSDWFSEEDEVFDRPTR